MMGNIGCQLVKFHLKTLYIANIVLICKEDITEFC